MIRKAGFAAIIVIASLLPLVLSSADAFAKSSHARSRTAAARNPVNPGVVNGVLSGAAVTPNGPTGTHYPRYPSLPPYPGGLGPYDNTAGWGDVGDY